MAIPSFVSAGAKSAGNGSITPALPSGMAANDICVLCATTLAGGTVSINSVGSVGTWTAVTGSPIDVTGGDKLYVWWGRWTSGTTGPTLIPGGDHICAGIAAWSGCVTGSSPIHVQATGSETTSDNSLSFATGISTTADDCLILLVSSTGADANAAQHGSQANSSLSNVTERIDYCTNVGGGGGFEVVEGGLATAGAIGTWTATLSTISPKAYVSFALKPITVEQGVVVLSGVGVLSGIPKTQRRVAGTLAGIGSIAAIGTVIAGAVYEYGVATMSGVGALASIGRRTLKSSASLAGSALLTSIGSRFKKGVASLSGVGVASSIARLSKSAKVLLTGSGSVAAIGTVILGAVFEYGVATMAAVGSLSATTKRLLRSTVLLQATGHTTSTPHVIRRVLVSLTGAGAVTVQGIVSSLVYGITSLSGVGLLSAKAIKAFIGKATMSGAGILRAHTPRRIIINTQTSVHQNGCLCHVATKAFNISYSETALLSLSVSTEAG